MFKESSKNESSVTSEELCSKLKRYGSESAGKVFRIQTKSVLNTIFLVACLVY